MLERVNPSKAANLTAEGWLHWFLRQREFILKQQKVVDCVRGVGTVEEFLVPNLVTYHLIDGQMSYQAKCAMLREHPEWITAIEGAAKPLVSFGTDTINKQLILKECYEI